MIAGIRETHLDVGFKLSGSLEKVRRSPASVVN